MDYLNIAKAKFPLDDPQLKDFVAAIGAVKPVAESSFVWRLVTGAPGEPVPTAYGDDRYVVNLSVWQFLETLQAFVSSAAHLGIMRRRAEWFERLDVATLVL